jgi:hypothetical protein
VGEPGTAVLQLPLLPCAPSSCNPDDPSRSRGSYRGNVKPPVQRMKSQARDWRKIFAKGTSDTEPLSKIYKEQLKINNKKTT